MKPLALITGTSQGIGKALALGYLNSGYQVIGVDIAANSIAEIEFYQVDLTKEAEIKKLVAQLSDRSFSVLINNAIKSSGKSYHAFSEVLSIGVIAPYYLATQLNFEEGASIINLGSTRAHQSQANTLAYSAAKGGIVALTHSLAVSLAPKVRCNVILPGWIDTKNISLSRSDHLQHPAGRVGKPQDIVEMALFLSSDKASFITGQEFVVDGGMSKLMIYHDDQGWKYQPK